MEASKHNQIHPDRILFALEIGGNSGHIGRAMAMARAATRRGCITAISASDIAALKRFAGDDLDMPVFQTAKPPSGDENNRPSINHAEILIRFFGYDNESALLGMVSQWLATIDEFKPSVIVSDYAPTAVIAARIRGIRVVSICSGFGIPPDTVPMPSFFRNQAITSGVLLSLEYRALSSVNAIMSKFGRPSFNRLSLLFNTDTVIIDNPLDLDLWGGIKGRFYTGGIAHDDTKSHVRLEWPQERPQGSVRILSYLHAHSRGLVQALEAMNRSGADVICTVAGLSDEAAMAFCSNRMLVTNRRINVYDLVTDATVALSYGGAGFIRMAINAGAPLVLVSDIVEQMLNSTKIVSLGAGKLVNPSASSNDILEAINTVASNESYRAAAMKFAANNRRPPDSEIVDRALDAVLGVAGSA